MSPLNSLDHSVVALIGFTAAAALALLGIAAATAISPWGLVLCIPCAGVSYWSLTTALHACGQIASGGAA